MTASTDSAVTADSDGRLRVCAGPARLGLSHLAAARRHFRTGVFSHRRRDERVSMLGADAARITYRIGWGPLSATIELLASLETSPERSTVWFACTKGLLPLAGAWRFEARADGGCDLRLDQTVDARRVPGFVPVRRLIRNAIDKAILEQLG